MQRFLCFTKHKNRHSASKIYKTLEGLSGYKNMKYTEKEP